MAKQLTGNAQELVQQYAKRERTLRRALKEHGAPERMVLTAGGGIAGGLLLSKVVDWIADEPLKNADKTKFIGKNPEFVKALGITAAGAALHIGNLAIGYAYPMDVEREVIHIGSAVTIGIGLDRAIRTYPQKTAA